MSMSESTDHVTQWHRAKYCSDAACVEVAWAQGEVLIRNNERPGQVVRFTRAEWAAFVAGVQDGDFPF
jgi:hypothetical protein